MGLLVWMVLVVLVSSVTHLSAVDVNWLTEVVKKIRREYKIQGQFCLAANIPITQDRNRLKEILSQNSFHEEVSDVVNRNEVYIGDSIIIAKPDPIERNIHAEYRVLEHLQDLKPNSDGNFLLIYSFLSPCRQCTEQNNRRNILGLISKYKDDWKDSAFVFKRIYFNQKQNVNDNMKNLNISISKLGPVMGGLSKVFRCDTQNSLGVLECHSCSDNGSNEKISNFCVATWTGWNDQV